MTTMTETTLTIEELRARLQKIAPEVRAGDPAAITEADEIEAALASYERSERIAALADAEETERERARIEAEREAERDVYRAEFAKTIEACEAALVKFERALPTALEAARSALELDNAAQVIADKIQPGSYRRRLNSEIENRMLRLIRDHLGEYYISPGVIFASQGCEPLAAEPASCAVCEHEHRDAIETERADGTSLRVLAERHNVGRSTLSEHFREHAEA